MYLANESIIEGKGCMQFLVDWTSKLKYLSFVIISMIGCMCGLSIFVINI